MIPQGSPSFSNKSYDSSAASVNTENHEKRDKKERLENIRSILYSLSVSTVFPASSFRLSPVRLPLRGQEAKERVENGKPTKLIQSGGFSGQTFFSYRKAFLSYWLCPFVGFMYTVQSINNLNASSMSYPVAVPADLATKSSTQHVVFNFSSLNSFHKTLPMENKSVGLILKPVFPERVASTKYTRGTPTGSACPRSGSEQPSVTAEESGQAARLGRSKEQLTNRWSSLPIHLGQNTLASNRFLQKTLSNGRTEFLFDVNSHSLVSQSSQDTFTLKLGLFTPSTNHLLPLSYHSGKPQPSFKKGALLFDKVLQQNLMEMSSASGLQSKSVSYMGTNVEKVIKNKEEKLSKTALYQVLSTALNQSLNQSLNHSLAVRSSLPFVLSLPQSGQEGTATTAQKTKGSEAKAEEKVSFEFDSNLKTKLISFIYSDFKTPMMNSLGHSPLFSFSASYPVAEGLEGRRSQVSEELSTVVPILNNITASSLLPVGASPEAVLGRVAAPKSETPEVVRRRQTPEGYRLSPTPFVGGNKGTSTILKYSHPFLMSSHLSTTASFQPGTSRQQNSTKLSNLKNQKEINYTYFSSAVTHVEKNQAVSLPQRQNVDSELSDNHYTDFSLFLQFYKNRVKEFLQYSNFTQWQTIKGASLDLSLASSDSPVTSTQQWSEKVLRAFFSYKKGDSSQNNKTAPLPHRYAVSGQADLVRVAEPKGSATGENAVPHVLSPDRVAVAKAEELEGNESNKPQLTGMFVKSIEDKMKMARLYSQFKTRFGNNEKPVITTKGSAFVPLVLSPDRLPLRGQVAKAELSPLLLVKNRLILGEPNLKTLYSGTDDAFLNLRKYEQKKRRRKKLKKETRVRKKRKRFYPRPFWMRYRLYNRFLNKRYLMNNDYSVQESSKNTRLSKKSFSHNFKEKTKLFHFTVNDLVQSNANKSFYTVSYSVLGDLKRVLWKSYWLRSNLNPYLTKVRLMLNEMKTYKQNQVGSFSEMIYKFIHSFNQSKFNEMKALSDGLSALPPAKWKETLNSTTISKWQNVLYLAEYDRITYGRLQHYFSQIRENVNVFGQNKVRLYHLGHSNSTSLLRKRKKDVARQNSSDLWVKLGKTLMTLAEGDPQFSYLQTKNPLNNWWTGCFLPVNFQNVTVPQLRMYWALAKTNIHSFTGRNLNTSFLMGRQQLWSLTKIREQTKNNKTKKLGYQLSTNVESFLTKQKSLVEYFNKTNNNKKALIFTKSFKKIRLKEEKAAYLGLKPLPLQVFESQTVFSQKNTWTTQLSNKSTYWWNKSSSQSYHFPYKSVVNTGLQNEYRLTVGQMSLHLNQSQNNPLETQTGIFKKTTQNAQTLWMSSLLFHFCTLLSLLSLSQVRSLFKVYLIVFSKIYGILKDSLQTCFSWVFLPLPFARPQKETAFGLAKGSGFNGVETEGAPQVRGAEGTSKMNTVGFTEMQTQKGAFSLLKLFRKIDSNQRLRRNGIITDMFNKKKNPTKRDFTALKTVDLPIHETKNYDTGNFFIIEQRFYSFIESLMLKNTKNDNTTIQPKTQTSSLTMLNSRKESMNFFVYFFLRYCIQKPIYFYKKGNIRNSAQGQPSSQSQPKILKTYTTLYSLVLLNFIVSTSYNGYSLVKSMVSQIVETLGVSVPRSIFSFFEKPGELILDWIAYMFLVEWASDIITTLPETVDNYLGSSSYKLLRTLQSIQFVSSVSLGFIFSQNVLKSAYLNSTPQNFYGNLQMENVGSVLTQNLTISSVFMKNRLYHLYEILVYQFYQPDTDLINRQKKGIIFWDIWGDFLTQVAEDSNINISELTSVKEEQMKLLEKCLDSSKTEESFGLRSSPLWFRVAGSSPVAEGEAKELKLKGSEPKKQKGTKTSMSNTNTHTRSTNQRKWVHLYRQGWLQKSSGKISPLISTQLATNNHSLERSPLVATALQSGCPRSGTKQSGTGIKQVALREAFPRGSGYKPGPQNLQGAQQFLSYQGKDSELFIDLHPPKNFGLVNVLTMNESVQQPVGSLVCQIFSGLLSKQISKNILVVSSSATTSAGPLRGSTQNPFLGNQKTLLIQAIAGETELKIITDNAYRYAMVYRGVAVGIKLLRDVFDSLSLHTPCLFLIEDIHAIGERRPLLISDDENTKGTSAFGSQREEVHEKNQILYQLSKHVTTHYRKPYKGDFSLLIPTNHFCFDLFRGSASAFNSSENGSTYLAPIPVSSMAGSEKTLSPRIVPSDSKDSTNSQSNTSGPSEGTAGSEPKGTPTTRLTIAKSELLSPPAYSPFSVLSLKEEKKFKPYTVVSEMPWAGYPGESLAQISKASYSIRVKVALLADMAISSLSVKLDMITDLLVIIDSVKGNRGFVVFATTHVPYILDPALRRPGRLDETITLSSVPTLASRWEVLKSIFSLPSGSPPATPTKNQSSSLKNYLLGVGPSSVPLGSTVGSALGVTRGFSAQTGFPNGSTLGQSGVLFNSNFNIQIFSKNLQKFVSSQIHIHKHKNQSNFSQESMIIPQKSSQIFNATSSLMFNPTLVYQEAVISNSQKGFSNSMQQNRTIDIFNQRTYTGKKKEHYSNAPLPSLAQSRKIISQTYFKSSLIISNANLFLKDLFAVPFNNAAVNQNGSSILTDPNTSALFLSLYSAQPVAFSNASSAYRSSPPVPDREAVSGKSRVAEQVRAKGLNSKTNQSSNTFLKTYILQFIVGKLGEMIYFSKHSTLNDIKRPVAFGESGTKKAGQCSMTPRFNHSGIYTTYSLNQLQSLSSLILLLLQKRFIYHKFLSFPGFLSFTNNTPLMEASSPPLSNILLPARRYENYKRSLYFYSGTKNSLGILEKINAHQQQRLVKRLYGYPVQEMFRSEILENRLTSFSNASLMIGSLSENLNKQSRSNFFNKKTLLNRHKNYLTNQWWNGQLPEHNSETTFLSDIDWRYTFSESVGDLLLDFPDAEQYYNPRQRRWILTKNAYSSWFDFDKTLYHEVYSHFIFESFNHAYKLCEKQRESLDYTSFNLLQNGLQYSLNEYSLLKFYQRFFH